MEPGRFRGQEIARAEAFAQCVGNSRHHTSHDRPVLVILDVGRCLQLLCGADQLVKLLAANNLVEIVRAVSAADTIGLSRHADWIKQALAELQDADGAKLKIREIERSPGE